MHPCLHQWTWVDWWTVLRSRQSTLLRTWSDRNILTGNITNWHGLSTAQDRKSLQSTLVKWAFCTEPKQHPAQQSVHPVATWKKIQKYPLPSNQAIRFPKLILHTQIAKMLLFLLFIHWFISFYYCEEHKGTTKCNYSIKLYNPVSYDQQ